MKTCVIGNCKNEVVKPKAKICGQCRDHVDVMLEHDYKKTLSDKVCKLLNNAAKRAARADRDFDIDLAYVYTLIPEDFCCPIFKKPFKVNEGNSSGDWSMSLDRIDNSLGYIKGNVQIISMVANRVKGKGTQDELLDVADRVFSNSDEEYYTRKVKRILNKD